MKASTSDAMHLIVLEDIFYAVPTGGAFYS